MLRIVNNTLRNEHNLLHTLTKEGKKNTTLTKHFKSILTNTDTKPHPLSYC